MTPLTNPVTGDENEVRIVKTSGFIWRDGEIAQSDDVSRRPPRDGWDLAGRPTHDARLLGQFRCQALGQRRHEHVQGQALDAAE